MPFNRRYDIATEDYVIDRTLTGPPIVPETGQAQTATGIIVGDSAARTIAPATPVKVTMPGPREPLMDASGMINPRWRRFFEELYRRTGQNKDNVNDTDRNIGDSTTQAVAFASDRPTVTVA